MTDLLVYLGIATVLAAVGINILIMSDYINGAY
jgi:hypothetical protein